MLTQKTFALHPAWLYGLLGAACFQCSPTTTTQESTLPTPEVFLVHQDTCTLGEGAYWHSAGDAFWWVDIEGMALHRLSSTGNYERHSMPSRIGTVVADTLGRAVVALENVGIGAYNWDTRIFSRIANPLAGMDSIRYNDGKCDPQGRLWVGSMHLKQYEGAAKLYRVDPDRNTSVWREGVTISNGLCWSADRRTMYYIDTPTGAVRAFAYNDSTGAIDTGRVVVTIPDTLGYPDGMTIDAEDKLWIALWNGNSITRWDPVTGALLEQIEVPAHNVTSVAFGTANYDTLYITTARTDMTAEELEQYPLSGSVFGVAPGVSGIPMGVFGQSLSK